MQHAWPRISVVTPSFNQGAFLESTIDSILSQKYPNLEYSIIDGGSTDGSQDIIKRYAKHLHYWVSEPDGGQTQAINKGLSVSTGEFFNWINSDDLLEPEALWHIGSLAPGANVIGGGCTIFSSQGFEETSCNGGLAPLTLIRQGNDLVFRQPALWFRRDRIVELGGFDDSLQFTFDWHFTIRYLSRFPEVTYTERTLARFRLHESSKTVGQWLNMRNGHIDALERLLNDDLTSAHRAAIAKRLREYRWLKRLSDIEYSADRAPAKIASILTTSMRHPGDALRRQTAGTIRRVLRRGLANAG